MKLQNIMKKIFDFLSNDNNNDEAGREKNLRGYHSIWH